MKEAPNHIAHLHAVCEPMEQSLQSTQPEAAAALREIPMREQTMGRLSLRESAKGPLQKTGFRAMQFMFVLPNRDFQSQVFTSSDTPADSQLLGCVLRKVFAHELVVAVGTQNNISNSIITTIGTEAAVYNKRHLLGAVVVNQEQDGSFFHEILYPNLEPDMVTRLRDMALSTDSAVQSDIQELITASPFSLPDMGPLKRMEPEFADKLSLVTALTFFCEQKALTEGTR